MKIQRQIWVWIWVEFKSKLEIQLKGLNFRGVTALSPYRNLILRFRGEENPRLRIGTWYLNRMEEDQDRWSEGISWSAGSSYFGRRATEIIHDALPTRLRGEHLPMVETSEQIWASLQGQRYHVLA
jgi:hypothetical protein